MIAAQFKGVNRFVSDYAEHINLFTKNARLYLIYVVITGAAIGVFRLLFNFYALSLGYDEALLGRLVTVSSLTALVVALPVGYLADILGRKISLLSSGVIVSFSVVMMVLWPSTWVLYAANMMSGFGQSLGAVTRAPFMMENSGAKERTYLFSFSMGIQMASASAGNWIGGYLPTWVANARGVAPTASEAYAGALLIVGVILMMAVIPLILLRTPRIDVSERSVFAPISYAAKNPAKLTKLILPMLLTSIGAGLIMPFMNVFFRQVHHQPDPVIGSLFAWGSLAMGVGLLIAPPLAERLGKIQLVVLTQGISIPFLVILGFSPWFWMSAMAYYIRLSLMNMSMPIYSTFVMEQVESSSRAMVASLTSMAWNFGWAFSPAISGWLQVKYGFGPAFLGTITLYTVSVILYWAFFLRKKDSAVTAPTPGG
ncbi:MAG: MFS transporter [Chloroflexota bacterium]|nr:MFS transporter [Chloroflexota bacterium]